MRLCLFEDRAEQLEPLSLTRPVFDLLCGITSLGAKLLTRFSAAERGVWVRPALEDLCRTQYPELHVNDTAWLRAGEVLLVNGRWLAPAEAFDVPAAPCVGMIGGEVAFAVLTAAQLADVGAGDLPALLRRWSETLPVCAAPGKLVCFPWDLVDQNAEQIVADFDALRLAERAAPAPAQLAVVGPAERLWVDPSARLDPLIVADTTQGPVIIDHHAVITAFTRLEGPCYIGPRTQVFGAKVRAGTTLGPQCRIGGEVEASIVHGHSNKYHDGFLGHSYVGEWVNLGAGTHNSDLRNDYGPVTVTIAGRAIGSGLSKVGCFLGDHTKTGLGTLINTGTSVGAFCNLLPAGRFAPKYIPSFASWWNGALAETTTLEPALATARLAMKRRGVALTEAHQALYARLYDATAAERRRVLRDAEQRALRRSA